MNISEIERKLIELDRNLHLILEMVRGAKEHEEDVVESAVGAWGYDVDSEEFVRELRRTKRLFFIDTSIFVDVLRSKQVELSKSLFKSLQGNKGFTSVITVVELSVRAYRSPRKDALEKTLKLLSIVNVEDLSGEIAV